MPLLTSTTERLAFTWTQYSRENPRGSGYCEDSGAYVADVTTWRLLGLKVWTRRVKVRDIPTGEYVAAACLGGYIDRDI
jgi:hypothetical protein